MLLAGGTVGPVAETVATGGVGGKRGQGVGATGGAGGRDPPAALGSTTGPLLGLVRALFGALSPDPGAYRNMFVGVGCTGQKKGHDKPSGYCKRGEGGRDAHKGVQNATPTT